MITHPAYAIEPWQLRETTLDLSRWTRCGLTVANILPISAPGLTTMPSGMGLLAMLLLREACLRPAVSKAPTCRQLHP